MSKQRPDITQASPLASEIDALAQELAAAEQQLSEVEATLIRSDFEDIRLTRQIGLAQSGEALAAVPSLKADRQAARLAYNQAFRDRPNLQMRIVDLKIKFDRLRQYPPASIDDATKVVQIRSAELAALNKEAQETLPKAKATMLAGDMDLDEMDRIVRREQRLPLLIASAELALWRAQVVLHDAHIKRIEAVDLPQAQGHMEAEQAAFNQAKAKLDNAKAAYRDIYDEQSEHSRNAVETRRRIAERQQALQRLPVTGSLHMAGR